VLLLLCVVDQRLHIIRGGSAAEEAEACGTHRKRNDRSMKELGELSHRDVALMRFHNGWKTTFRSFEFWFDHLGLTEVYDGTALALH
jgi:hypothetical protein